MITKFKISGMRCASCAAHVEKAVRELPGIVSAHVNLLANLLTVEHESPQVTVDKVISAVAAAGYKAEESLDDAAAKPADNQAELKAWRRRLWWSVGFLLILLYVSMQHMTHVPLPAVLCAPHNPFWFGLLQLILLLPILYLNRDFFINGIKTLLHGAPNMDSLVGLGAGAGVVYSLVIMGQCIAFSDTDLTHLRMDFYFEGAGMILTLITLGKFLEARAKGHTGDAIAKLLSLAPQTAVIEVDNAERSIPIAQLQRGDVMIIRSGSAIPADGVVILGNAAVDEAMLTGESIPVEKSPDMSVSAATVLVSGFIKVRAQKVGQDTTLAQIVKLVEAAGGGKAPIARFADKVSGVFVPIVILIAAVTLIAWLLLGHGWLFAVSSAIAVLVVSCPCALGLATPVAIMTGSGKAAECGILFKTAAALEQTNKVDCVVFDKTGTLTTGQPVVTDVITLNECSTEKLITLAAGLETPSEHPLARAVVKYAAKRQFTPVKVDDFIQIPGGGVMAQFQNQELLGGNIALLQEMQVALNDSRLESCKKLSAAGKTVLGFALNNKLLGFIAVADQLKNSAQQAVRELKNMNVQVVMLTGDHQLTADAIAQNAGIANVIAEVLPQEKAKEIENLKSRYSCVAMVGDGINDAPALAASHIGIAIGHGTDIAIEAAGIVLMNNALTSVPQAIKLSHAVVKNIKENLFWAFFYNVLGIPLAAGAFYFALGWKLNPIFAAAAMSLSSFCVVTNALRLRFFK